MAGEIALFLINQVLEETPSTWVPGDPLYDDPRQEDEDENFDPQPSVYVRPMFELLYDDPDDHPFESFFGPWYERRGSYRYRPPIEFPPLSELIVFHTTQVHDVTVSYMGPRLSAHPIPTPHVLAAIQQWRLDP